GRGRRAGTLRRARGAPRAGAGAGADADAARQAEVVVANLEPGARAAVTWRSVMARALERLRVPAFALFVLIVAGCNDRKLHQNDGGPVGSGGDSPTTGRRDGGAAGGAGESGSGGSAGSGSGGGGSAGSAAEGTGGSGAGGTGGIATGGTGGTAAGGTG